MKEYKMETWKLRVEGKYKHESRAIRALANKYMKISPCDPPGEHPVELLTGVAAGTNIENIGKRVWFYVKEEVYGRMQWVEKYELIIHPFSEKHWWPSGQGFIPPDQQFRYKKCKPELTESK